MNPNQIADIIDNRVVEATDKALNRTYKRGTIAVAAGTYADVYVEGNTVSTKNLPILGSYMPQVGDKVLVLSIGDSGTNLIILGPIYSTSPTTSTIATATTITPSATNYTVTALASAATIASPGVMANGTRLTLRIKDNGTARALTWNAVYRGVGTSLPSTTVAGKVMYVGMIYNSQDAKWDVVAVSQQA